MRICYLDPAEVLLQDLWLRMFWESHRLIQSNMGFYLAVSYVLMPQTILILIMMLVMPLGLKEILAEEWGETTVVPISNFNTLQLSSLIKDISKFYEVPLQKLILSHQR
jgi:hypothetical protein